MIVKIVIVFVLQETKTEIVLLKTRGDIVLMSDFKKLCCVILLLFDTVFETRTEIELKLVL